MKEKMKFSVGDVVDIKITEEKPGQEAYRVIQTSPFRIEKVTLDPIFGWISLQERTDLRQSDPRIAP